MNVSVSPADRQRDESMCIAGVLSSDEIQPLTTDIIIVLRCFGYEGVSGL